MRSYPNLIPLSAKQVTGIAVALEPFQFDTIYGHYFDRVITSGGKQIAQTGGLLPQPVVVQVIDEQGAAVAGARGEHPCDYNLAAVT